MGGVLGIVYRVIATHLIKKAGLTKKTARTGAVTLIQRFGSALNLNIHFHMLFLDGVYTDHSDGSTRFRWVNAPPAPSLPIWRTPSAIGSGVIWNGKGCWNETPRTATLPGMRWTTIP